MEKYAIEIAHDFSDKPGGRFQKLGPNSGEEFYQKLLLPRYEAAVADHEKLYVYLDGAKSYPNSFLDQSFGILARTKSAQEVCSNIVFRTELFQWVVKYINDEIWFKK